MSSPSPAKTTIEVYVRELIPNKNRQLNYLLDRIDHLAATDVIADSTVSVVGKQICPKTASLTDCGQDICGRVRQFQKWAEQADKQLDSFFPTTEVQSAITGDEYTTISFPTVTMVEYVDDSLQFVTPCSDGDTAITPRDRLDELAGQTHKRPQKPDL